MAAATTTKAKRWFPLESNPQVMNEYIRRMGIAEDAEFAFCDVYSTDDWALEMVLRPVLGVVMLFPIKPAVRQSRVGSVAHASHGSFLSSFFSKTDGKTPDEIAAILQADDEIEETHASAAQDGQSEQLEHVDDPINTHFVCFSVVDGHLYELDGRKEFPINHGPSSPETLLGVRRNQLNMPSNESCR
ncbi:hypothetical protein B5M09_001912 [Aphanomyces astaci]|uniref:Ubiquitin carboxyl-terminal hydrolase n=1 Tax=Aphanomyces astaci TaxID=112090 RepID=A0A3R7ZHJ9_APHAT|nr:hypothetical protein B5M09_001912 [Aphanomyces astaci]